MHIRTIHKIFALGLTLCVFSVSILLATATAKHATHTSHDQHSHQQTWCGWQCAAGQAIDAESLDPLAAFTLVASVETDQPLDIALLLPVSSRSRAPPLLT